jgi:hypothetical protein
MKGRIITYSYYGKFLPAYISKQSTMQCVFYKLTYHVTYVADVIQIFSIIETWLTAFKWVVSCVTLSFCLEKPVLLPVRMVIKGKNAWTFSLSPLLFRFHLLRQYSLIIPNKLASFRAISYWQLSRNEFKYKLRNLVWHSVQYRALQLATKEAARSRRPHDHCDMTTSTHIQPLSISILSFSFDAIQLLHLIMILSKHKKMC